MSRKNGHQSLDISGAVALGFYEKTFQILSQDAGAALKRPWHKLERGLRIGRLREFVAREAERLKLVAEDSDTLFKLLLKGLDRKLLSSKAAVTYEPDKEQITEIKGLVAHTSAAGRTKYQLIEKKAGTTQRRRVNNAVTTNTNTNAIAKETAPINSNEGDE